MEKVSCDLDGEILAVLMCPPLSMFPAHPPPDQPGCEKASCDDCARPIWISEKKRAIRDSRPKAASYVVCYFCLKKKARSDKKFFEDHIRINL
jgi:hypothetical protein